MRTSLCLAAFVLLTAPAFAAAASGSSDVEVVPQVNPGDQIGIACVAIAEEPADSDVRVVLTIAAAPNEAPVGYRKVLATDEQVAHGAVRVRIPSVPDLEDHTVNVNVYVLGDKATESCDAGHMKVVRRHTAQPSHPIG